MNDNIIKYLFSLFVKKLSSKIIVKIKVNALIINEIFSISLLEINRPNVWEAKYPIKK